MRIFEFDDPWDRSSYFDNMVEFWKTWKVARRRCSDFIAMCKRSGAHPMVRGFRAGKNLPLAFRGTSEARFPEHGERREEVDEWLSAHGFNALRANSLFCANSADLAFTYAKDGGQMYYILPENGYEYTWYEEAADLYQLNFNLSLKNDVPIDELMQQAKPTNKDIERALTTPRLHEIHFVGGYVGFNRDRYGLLLFAEMHGQGVQNQVKWGRVPPDVCERLGLKPPKTK